MNPTPLIERVIISTPMKNHMLIDHEYVNCPLRFDDRIRPANLLPIHMLDFDVILGMDWLASHRATIDCYARTVIFGNVRQPEFVYHGSSPLKSVKLISAIKARTLISHGCQAYLQKAPYRYETVELLKVLREQLQGDVGECLLDPMFHSGGVHQSYLLRDEMGACACVLITANSYRFTIRGIIMDPSKVEESPKWPRHYYGDGGEEVFGACWLFRQRWMLSLCVEVTDWIVGASMRIESNLMLQIKEAQRDDGELWAIVQNVEDGKHTEFSVDDDGVVWFEDRLCVPNDQALREKVMMEAHSSPFTIHPGYKWIFKKKMKADGTIDKYKARLVIKGFRQREGLDYFDTYSPITRITSIRMVLAISALRNLEVQQMDVKPSFLNGDLEEGKYMNQLEGS
ncbi:putative reverse transcriptase domain-containing protein [Tanacetum coccineum]